MEDASQLRSEVRKRAYKKVSIFLILLFPLIPLIISADDPRVLQIGLYENEPKIFTQEGKALGFWPDIIEYITKEEGWKIEWVPGSWAECLERLETGEIDVMPDVGYTEERERKYAFQNETVYISWSRIYVPEGSELQSFPDLEGKEIAVLKDSVNYVGTDGIKELTEKFGIDCVFIEMNDYNGVFESLEDAKADAAVVNKEFGDRYEGEYKIERTGIVFQPMDLKFAFSKTSPLTPYLIERTDYLISKLKGDKDSIYYQSMERYFEVGITRETIIPGWVKWVLIGIIGVIALLAGGNFILSRRVESRTEELRESEVKYRRLVEMLNEGIWRIDAEGYTAFVNPKMAEILGYTVEEMKGEHLFVFMDDVRLKEAKRYLKKRCQGVTEQHEFTFQKKSGEPVHTLVNTSPIFDERGNYIGALAGITDITKLRKIEEALEESKIRFRNIFNQTFQLVGIVSLDGTLKAANKMALDFIGANESDVIGKPFWDTPWWQHSEELKEWLRDAIPRVAQREILRREVTHLSKDGDLHYFDFSFKPVLDEKRRVRYLIPESRDITDQKKAENQRERAWKEAEFYADVLAHDTGNLSQVILAHLHLLKTANDDETRERNVAGVRRSVMELKQLAESIRTLKKIDTMSIERINLSKIMEHSVEKIKEWFDDRNITVNLSIDDEYRVMANESLNTVFFNILENAVEYTFHDPVRINIWAEKEGGDCKVHVRDYGIGIPPNKREDILRSLETLSGRTGLGLYLTKKLMEKFNGKIEISRREKGTEICIVLPILP